MRRVSKAGRTFDFDADCYYCYAALPNLTLVLFNCSLKRIMYCLYYYDWAAALPTPRPVVEVAGSVYGDYWIVSSWWVRRDTDPVLLPSWL